MRILRAFCLDLSIISFLFVSNVYSQEPYFQDIAAESGMQGLIDLVQYGAAWIDFDGDGDEDCFVATHPENQLFQNNGDSTFSDIAGPAGIGDPGFGASGGAWGDYDGDGDPDLFIANLSAEEDRNEGDGSHGGLVLNRLLRNNGDGTFTDVAGSAGVSGEIQNVTGGSTSASWADYNSDGHLDLLVCNRFAGALLYRNDGNGVFTFASHEAGFLHEHEEEHGDSEHRHEFQSAEHAAWSDYDNDSDLDVYFSVALAEEHHHDDSAEEEGDHEHEAVETRNFLFRNNGDGTFTDVSEESGLLDPNHAVSHSSVWGDYDNDGDSDLFVGNIGSVNEGTAVSSQLFRNNGDGTFTDVSEAAGIHELFYAFNAVWADVNNDGFLDLPVILHPSHEDFPTGVLYQFPHPLYLSNGDGTFTNINADVSDALLVTGMADISHLIGTAWGDADGDGDLDALYTENHGDGPIRLYENLTLAGDNHWLRISLESDTPNRYGVGAAVYVSTDETTQMQTVGIGSTGWGSSSPLTLHFGMGTHLAASVDVRWPDGMTESFGLYEVDQNLTLIEGRGQTTRIHGWSLY